MTKKCTTTNIIAIRCIVIEFKSNVMIENIFQQTKHANKIIYIEHVIDILSKNSYKVGSEIENRKLNQLTEKLLENTIFENKNKSNKKDINENRNTLKSIIANNFADEENEVRNECYIKNLVMMVLENETIFDELKEEKLHNFKYDTVCNNIRNYQMQSIKTEIKNKNNTASLKTKLEYVAACGLMQSMFVLLMLNMFINPFKSICDLLFCKG